MFVDFQGTLLRFLALLPALTLHEFAHAYSSHLLGDPTPQAHGRVTLNPLAHLDPIGTLMILFGPIGWAKPVPIDPTHYRYPSRDIVITSAAGPLSNLVQGVFWGLVFRAVRNVYPAVLMEGSLLRAFLLIMVFLNFVLAVFNLIPLGVLDGHHILEYRLPYDAAVKYRRFNHQYGMFILMAAILGPYVLGSMGMVSIANAINVLGWVVFLPASFLTGLVTGVYF